MRRAYHTVLELLCAGKVQVNRCADSVPHRGTLRRYFQHVQFIPIVDVRKIVVVVVVVSHIQRIGCQPAKNFFTRWSIPLVVS